MVSTTTTAAANEVISSIRANADEFERYAPENELGGKLNDASLALLHKTRVIDVMAPVKYGGLDLHLYDVLRVHEVLASIDSSASWTAMVHGVQGKALLLLEEGDLDALSKAGYPRVAGQGAPNGTARKVDGGYRVTGTWAYGSGMYDATMATGLAVVVDDKGPVLDSSGNKDLVIWFTPVENVEFKGNWDVLGMRGTGSIDFSAKDVFVPHSCTARDAFTTRLGGEGHSKLVGFTGWIMMVHCGAPLGSGRRILDDIAKFALTPNSRGLRLADESRFAHAYGVAEGKYRSARAFLYESFGEAQERINRGESVTRHDLTNMRAASVLMHDVNVENATWAFREAGGASLRNGDLQRWYRDVMAQGQHLQASPQTWMEIAKDYLGQADGLTWALNKLV